MKQDNCPLRFADNPVFGIQMHYRKENDVNQFDNKLIAMSNVLAKKQTKWTVTEKKLFFLTISQLRWKENSNSNVIELRKADIYEKLDLNPDDLPSGYLRNQFKSMASKSWIEFGDDEDFDDNFLIVGCSGRGKTFKVTINPIYMPLVQELNARYTMFWLDDLLEFESKHAMTLYQTLRRLFREDLAWSQPIDFTTVQLKDVFGLSKDDYMNKKSGKFERTNFEKYCVQRAVDEINSKCQAMHIFEWFKDYDRSGHVKKYVFQVSCKTREYQPKENAHEEDTSNSEIW